MKRVKHGILGLLLSLTLLTAAGCGANDGRVNDGMPDTDTVPETAVTPTPDNGSVNSVTNGTDDADRDDGGLAEDAIDGARDVGQGVIDGARDIGKGVVDGAEEIGDSAADAADEAVKDRGTGADNSSNDHSVDDRTETEVGR